VRFAQPRNLPGLSRLARSEWSDVNSAIFPVTSRLVRDVAKAPSLECFFARQAPGSGIAEHTDGCNFVMTAHLGLFVPPGGADACWLQVGNERRGWKERQGLVFDTSFMHSTWNASPDVERLVLLIRFWHPQLSEAERIATQWLFDASDDSSAEGLAAASRVAERRLRELVKAKPAPVKAKGFGKR